MNDRPAGNKIRAKSEANPGAETTSILDRAQRAQSGIEWCSNISTLLSPPKPFSSRICRETVTPRSRVV
jgi:hypothetical protein